MTTMNDLKTQYVYIMSNPSYDDDVFKIGWTRKSPLKRANELHASGIPTPFVVESVITTMEGSKLEQQIHNHLKQYRMNNKREFFKILKDNLIEILTTELKLELTIITELDAKQPKCEQKKKEIINNKPKYVCKACEYHCKKKSNYVQHCETEKHKHKVKMIDARDAQSSDLKKFMETMITMHKDMLNTFVETMKEK